MIQKLSGKTNKYNKSYQKLNIAIIRSNYHEGFTKSMEDACRKTLSQAGVNESNIKTFEVPGSWEIPLIAQNIAKLNKFDGIVAFGVILKGETYHFELIANECARALLDIALEFNIPVTFEVLAVYSLDQAKKRTTGKYNKGIEAASSLLSTIKVLSQLKKL